MLVRLRRLGRLLGTALPLLLLLPASCSREQREQAIGEGYVGANTVPLRDRLGAGPQSLATLEAGDRVEILQRRRRMLRVRTAAGVEGWLEERHVIASELYQQAKQLLGQVVTRPSQARARARAVANLHIQPARGSPRLFQLEEDEACDVLEHRAVERPLPPGAAPPGSPPTAPPAAKKVNKRRAPQPATPKMEDWFLVRAKGKAGWALARFIDMALPDEVVELAEGRAITAWQVLGQVEADEETKAHYVWATSQQVGSPYDFDGLRVITWNSVRKRYEVAYQEWGLRGVYPLAVGREMLDGSDVPVFAITTLDREGKRAIRHYQFVGNKVRKKQ